LAHVNIDDLLAAQREAAASEGTDAPTHHTFTFRGQEFTVPATIPTLAFSESARVGGQQGDLARSMFAFLGPDQYERLVGLVPDDDETAALQRGIVQLYGLTPGESSASPASSPTTGEPARPTSATPTESDSPERSSDASEGLNG
jgi:hypothetical protein